MGRPLTPVDFFLKAHFEPVPAAVLLLLAAWYGWSVARLRRRGRSWPVARSASFALAWLLVAVSTFSGLPVFARTNFSAFASQYIMVGLLAPTLLAFAAPISLAVQSSSRPARLGWMERLPARVAAHPFATWIIFAATVFVLFFTKSLLGAVLRGGAVEQVVFLWLLAAGWLYCWPVADIDPAPVRMGHWPRILYLLLEFPVFAIMGMGLESQGPRVAAAMTPGSLHVGGAVIWVVGEGISLLGAIAVFVQWLRTDERRAKGQDTLNEAAAARQLALWRASREAAARAASR
jgi:putative membrane protein